MASGELSLTSNSSQEDSNHEFGCYPNERSRKPSTESAKNFETIKQQYDQAMMELNTLRKQQADGKLQMERIMEQLEFYRNKYVADSDQSGGGGGSNSSGGMAQSTLKATTNLRTKFEDISNENIRLQQRIHHLEKKLSRQEKESTNSQAVCAFVEEYNELKSKYESSRLEFDKLSKETVVCKKLCSDLSRDRNSLALEKDDLKRQLSNVYAQLDGAIREKTRYRETHEKLLQQHDENMKELSQVLQGRAEELRRVTAQRNAAELELRTILGERKDVLEENQKLNDDLAAAKQEIDKFYKNDEDMKRKIDSLLRYQNDLIIERNNLREVLEEKEMLKARESAWGENLSASKDKFEQHNVDLEASNKEIEKLRKNLDKAKVEIEKATQETEVAKSRRDWAISEREKIVLERDSVKTLCDELRKERDTAVSDLLEAIRDSEQIKKQKDEACKEVEQLREQMEVQLNSSQRNVLWSYLPYEVPKNDTEVVEIDMSEALSTGDIGIMLEGGREDSQNRIDGGIVVVGVAKDSPAYGKLRVNDCIMQVNNLDCSSVSKRIVIEAIRNGGQHCELIVRRPPLTKSHMYEVQLNVAGSRNHGLTLETGIFISKIAPNSLAAKEDELAAGDRVLSINNKSMEGVATGKEAMLYLDDNRSDTITIIGLKQIKENTDDSYAQIKPNRVMNSCTQTDERYNLDIESNRNSSSGNSKSTSKISEMFNKFRGKIHIHGHQKGSTASESDSLCQENDAIAVLDSVLNNENSSASGKVKENLFKRSKKGKKESTKEANKNLGTWPRANILNTSNTQENPTGTIVQHRKKERPALTLFTGPISLGKDEKSSSSSKKENYFASHGHENLLSSSSKPGMSGAGNSNRNSNPIPFHVMYQPPPPSVLNRHSVYSTLETEPVLLETGKSIPSKASDLNNHKYHHHHHHHNVVLNNNRLSLNITPSLDNSLLYNTVINRKNPVLGLDSKMQMPSHPNSLDYVAMKNSTDSLLNSKSPLSSLDFKPTGSNQQQDLISLKSQNSIDSFLSPKSPPSIDMLSKPLVSRDASEFYTTKRLSRHTSKFPSDSDSLGMESISSPSSSNYTSTLPSYLLNARSQSSVPPSSRNQRLFPSHLPPHSHPLRQTSPLTIPMTQSIDISANNSADKLEFDYGVQSIHAHGVSMDIDPYHRNKIHPVRDRDVIFGSYGLSYEGGTFPRKKENQRVRIPSNPSVASRGSDMKNSTGSIERGGNEHTSLMQPAYKVEVLSHGGNKRNSMPDYCPSPGDIRRVTIDKSAEPLGITIQCNNNGGGIFVSTVTANSIASQVNLSFKFQIQIKYFTV